MCALCGHNCKLDTYIWVVDGQLVFNKQFFNIVISILLCCCASYVASFG